MGSIAEDMNSQVIEPKRGFLGWGDGLSPPKPEIATSSPSEEFASQITKAGITEVSEYLSRMKTTPLPTETKANGGGEASLEIDGRPYVGGKYPLPNDKQEQDRLTFQHKCLQVVFAGHYHFAPLPERPLHVLDVGTGTGVWAIEFAKENPSAQVIGSDLSAIQPTNPPSNCSFIQADAEEPWLFPHKFDLIHGRALLTCFSDPKLILQHAYSALSPGGYLEMHDGTYPFSYTGPKPTNSHLYQWSEICVAGGVKLGRPWDNAKYYKGWMEEIGFEDVVERQFFATMSPWAEGEYFQQVGRYWRANWDTGLEAISLKVMGVLGWEVEPAKAFLGKVKEELWGNGTPVYLPVNVVYGRKPLNAV